jgi:hypothetical protein
MRSSRQAVYGIELVIQFLDVAFAEIYGSEKR